MIYIHAFGSLTEKKVWLLFLKKVLKTVESYIFFYFYFLKLFEKHAIKRSAFLLTYKLYFGYKKIDKKYISFFLNSNKILELIFKILN